MKFGNPNHGHEKAKHRGGKKRTGDEALAGGAEYVRFELGGCDGVAAKRINGKEHTIGFEMEMSSRNALRNVTRDINELHLDVVAVIAGSEKVRKAINKCLTSRLPPGLLSRVVVVTDEDVSEQFFRELFVVRLGAGASTDVGTERGCPASTD